ncbi:MAG: hypothetical protein JWR69_4748 [Pedosphaera sp.]|nr:hypothetical protein [Pedosphaera sp.]
MPAMAQTQTQPQTDTQPQTQSQSQTNKPEAVGVTEVAKVKATVQHVDPILKRVTLKTPDGNTVKLRLKNAQNLSQLKKGDIVNVDYLQSTAVALAKPGQEPTGREVEQFVAVPDKGQMPGGVQVTTIKETATIDKIDHKKRMVTLKEPDGTTVRLKVDPRVTNFDQLKKGDQVAVSYTEAVAVTVEKPQSQG